MEVIKSIELSGECAVDFNNHYSKYLEGLHLLTINQQYDVLRLLFSWNGILFRDRHEQIRDYHTLGVVEMEGAIKWAIEYYNSSDYHKRLQQN